MHRYFYDWEFQEQQDPKTGLTTIFPISLGIVADDGRWLYLVNNSYFAWEQQGLVKTSDWVKENVLEQISDSDRAIYGVNFKRFGMHIENFISYAGRIKDRIQVELWGYYADYDHIALSQCFGSMMNLPDSIPMFTHDVKQILGEKAVSFIPDQEHHALSDAHWNKKVWELLMKNDEIKAELYDLNKKMAQLAQDQTKRWNRYKELERLTEEAHHYYNDGTYAVSDVHRRIKELESNLNDI